MAKSHRLTVLIAWSATNYDTEKQVALPCHVTMISIAICLPESKVEVILVVDIFIIQTNTEPKSMTETLWTVLKP
jgi:hypothetical protein